MKSIFMVFSDLKMEYSLIKSYRCCLYMHTPILIMTAVWHYLDTVPYCEHN